jgi:hypothetical protein
MAPDDLLKYLQSEREAATRRILELTPRNRTIAARAPLGAVGFAPSLPPSKFDGLIGGALPMRRGDE